MVDARKGGGGSRQAIGEGAAKAPGEEFIAEEVSRAQHARRHHPFAEPLAALQAPSDDEDHAPHGVSFSDHLAPTLGSR